MSRTATNRLLEMLEEGTISHQFVADMCLSFMSEDDVADMMDSNELSERFDEEPDVDESQEWTDFDPDC